MRVCALLVVLLAMAGRGRADEDGPRVDPYAGWGPKLDAVLAQVPTGPGDAGRLLAVIDAAQRDPDPVGAFARGLAGLEGDLRVSGLAMKGLLLQLGLQNAQLAADRAAAGLPPGPPAPAIAETLARSLTGITKVGPSIVIDRSGGPLDLPLPGGGGRFARLGERIAFSAQRGPEGEPVIGPAPVFEVEDGEERLKTYSDHGWIAGLELVNADGKVSRAIRSLGLRERRGRRVVELAVDAYGNRELFVRTPVDAGAIDRTRGPIPRGPTLSTLDKVAGLLRSGPPAPTPAESVGIVGFLSNALSGSGGSKPTPPAPTPTPPVDERRAEVVPDDQLPPHGPAVGPDDDAVAVDDDAVGPDEDAMAIDDESLSTGSSDPRTRPVGGDEDALAVDPRGEFLDPDAPDERDAVAVEDAEPSGEPARSRPAGAARGAPRDDRSDPARTPGASGGRGAPRDDRSDAATTPGGPGSRGEGAGAHPLPAPRVGPSGAPAGQPPRAGATGRPDPLASILQPLLQGLPGASGGGGAKGGAGRPAGASPSTGAAPAQSSADPELVATRAAVRALLRRALAQPRARRADVLLDGLDPLVASRPAAHEPLIRQAIARALLDRRFSPPRLR